MKDKNNELNEFIKNLEKKLLKNSDTSLSNNLDVNDSFKKDYKVIINFLSEYLSSFCIIGYTNDNDRILFLEAKSPKDYDALIESVKNALIMFLNKGNS